MRVGVVGVGHLGSIHARIWSEIPEVDLVGVHDSNPSQGERVASLHGTTAFSSIDSLVDAVDIVSIATPTPIHLITAAPFLEAGKAVLIEKPLAPTLEDADEILRLAAKSNSILQVGHVERFSPCIRAALPHIENPVFIECDRIHPYSLRSTEVSVVVDLMIHDIDIALHLADDEIESIDAFGCPVLSPTEDLATSRLSFSGGATALVKTSRVAFQKSRKVRIFCPRSYISLDLVENTGFKISLDPDYDPSDHLDDEGRILAPEGAETFLSQHMHQEAIEVLEVEPLRAELEAFLQAARGDRPPAVSGLQGRRAIATAALVVERIREHREKLSQRPGHPQGIA